MKISTYKNCITAYTDGWSGWEDNFDIEREDSLKTFPHSIIVEGDTTEIDQAIMWCVKFIGQPDLTSDLVYLKNSTGELKEIKRFKEGNWKSFFYGKVNYDYGFCEFFFKEKKSLEKFQGEVPHFVYKLEQ